MMHLRPTEFEVDSDDPFGNDAVGREGQIRPLAEVIMAEEHAAVVSVDGAFGSGKTSFLKILSAHLRLDHGADVVSFNAWQQSYTRDPLTDIASVLASGRSRKWRKLARLASKAGRRLFGGSTTAAVRSATFGFVDLQGLAGTLCTESKATSEAWRSHQNRTDQFKKLLTELVTHGGGKLVVIVDELDRCRPDYAIDVLNVVRHLFDLPGVIIVLGVNRDELEHRVREVFGERCNADAYLRRYVDLSRRLDTPTAEQLRSFTNSVIYESGLGSSKQSDMFEESLAHLVAGSYSSLRDAQQMACLLATVGSPHGKYDEEWQIAALALLMLSRVDPVFYQEFVTGERDGIDAIVTLQEALPQMWMQDLEFGTARFHLHRSLLHMLLPGSVPTVYIEGFAERYEQEELGDRAAAEALLEDWSRILNSSFACSDDTSEYSGLCSVADVARRLDGCWSAPGPNCL